MLLVFFPLKCNELNRCFTTRQRLKRSNEPIRIKIKRPHKIQEAHRGLHEPDSSHKMLGMSKPKWHSNTMNSASYLTKSGPPQLPHSQSAAWLHPKRADWSLSVSITALTANLEPRLDYLKGKKGKKRIPLCNEAGNKQYKK